MIDPDRPLHHYEEPGAYAIAVVGSLAEDAAFGAHPYYHQSDEFVQALESWGDLGLTSLENAFMYAKNLEAVPDHLPEGVTSLSAMFNGAVSFNQDLNGWDTSRVTDFSSIDRKSTRLNFSHVAISYAVFCLKKKKNDRSTGHKRRT